MRRVVLLPALLVSMAGFVFLQDTAPRSDLASMMPGGAMLYLEAQDLGRLLREWNASKIKADWLGSENYAVFSRSNLLQKLEGVYSEYGAAAGFLLDLKGAIGIAGTESALALYGIREVEFLYISRVGQAQLARSQLWAARDKFEQRQAGGVSFYLRTNPASRRTVAFAFVKGYLFLATRDDLVARALTLLAGGSDPSIASDRWYKEAVAAAPTPGELRVVMNLESLEKSVYLRSYWIHRNASVLRQYWTAVADVTRSTAGISESRIFLRKPEAAGQATTGSVAELVALVPPEAGLYKASSGQPASATAALILQKLIAAPMRYSGDWRFAPDAVSPDEHAGAETDLETRIDEPPLPVDAGISDSQALAQSMLEKAGAKAVLQLQWSVSAGGPFLRTPSVIVVAGDNPWDRAAVQAALTSAVGPLWTTSGLGAGWTPAKVGQHSVERLEGLGTLMVAVRGPLLFLANDALLLSATLDRAGTMPSNATPVTYAAGFRHARERRNFERIMTALDSGSPVGESGFAFPRSGASAPAFFSGNLAGLSRVLSHVSEVRVIEEAEAMKVRQVVVYQTGP